MKIMIHLRKALTIFLKFGFYTDSKTRNKSVWSLIPENMFCMVKRALTYYPSYVRTISSIIMSIILIKLNLILRQVYSLFIVVY